MINSKYEIWIEAEQWPKEEWDIIDGNTDVIVNFDDGTTWSASFFTYSNISKLVKKNKETGECLGGKYFWSSNMMLIDQISREGIEEVIKYLIKEGEFREIFKRCSS